MIIPGSAFARLSLASLAAVAGLVVPAAADGQAQGARCGRIELVLDPGSRTRYEVVQLPTQVIYAGGGIVMVCRGEGIRLVADSAEYYQATELIYLFGNVRYTERGTSVTANRITYWKNDERILAEGNVVARLENGTRLTGPRADYFRAVPGIRPRAQLRAPDRPRITLVQADTTNAGVTPSRTPRPPTQPAPSGRPADTTIVDANTVFMDGDSLIYASGKVIVTRLDVVATSDSLFLDRATERARFLGNPIITGSGERPFRLTGTVIDLFSRDRRLERVLSRVNAKVVSEDLELASDTIDMRLADNRLERAYAWGTSRARAVSTAQDMTADSIEIIMPAQRLREVRAIGKALAESEPDSLKMDSDERDWIRGDTIIALFDSIPLADTTSKPRIQELRARVMASSFYQIPPDDSTSRCPNINFARGDEIRVLFDSQSVRRVSVTDSVNADGVYLECGRAAAGPPGTPTVLPVAPPPATPPPASRPAAPPPAGIPPSAVPIPRPPPDAGRRR